MMLYHPGTDEITDTCGNKGKQHLHRSSAEKKRKSATRQRRSHSQLPGRLERMNLFYFIQTFVDLLSRQLFLDLRKVFYKLLHPIKFGCIDPCIGYT